MPIGSWFKSGALIVPEDCTAGMSSRFVAERLAAHRRGKTDQRAFLWNLLVVSEFNNRSVTRV